MDPPCRIRAYREGIRSLPHGELGEKARPAAQRETGAHAEVSHNHAQDVLAGLEILRNVADIHGLMAAAGPCGSMPHEAAVEEELVTGVRTDAQGRRGGASSRNGEGLAE